MKLIICLDEKKGMLFNGRRQSRDRVLIENLETYVAGAPVYMAPYSESLFLKSGVQRKICAEPLTEAPKGAYCFVECTDPAPFEKKLTEVVLYHWNRHYPSDLTFTMDMSGFRLTSTEEFVGSSHEKITREVWKK